MASEHKRSSVLTVGVLVILGLPGSPMAARIDTDGASLSVNVTENAYSVHPEIVVLANGNFVVLWSGALTRSASATIDILAQRFSTALSRTGTQFAVNTPESTPGSAEQLPRASAFSGGGFGVAWENAFDDDGDDYGVFARVVSPAAIPVGDDISVPAVRAGAQEVPSIASQPTGFVVSWKDTGKLGLGRPSLYFQRFAIDGERLGSVVEIDQPKEDRDPTGAELATSPGGDILVVWGGHELTTGHSRILARSFTEDGSAAIGEFEVGGSDSYQIVPTLRALPTGGAVVAWVQLVENAGVYARIVNFDGTFETPPFRVSDEWPESTTLLTRSVRLAAFEDGMIVAIWSRVGEAGEGILQGRIFARDGVARSGEFSIAASSGQHLPLRFQYAVDRIGAYQFAVVWEEHSGAEEDRNIQLQAFCVREDGAPVCGDATCSQNLSASETGEHINIVDALAVLQSAVGIRNCRRCVCDVNGSGEVTAIDSLAVLRSAAGLPVSLDCPECEV